MDSLRARGRRGWIASGPVSVWHLRCLRHWRRASGSHTGRKCANVVDRGKRGRGRWRSRRLAGVGRTLRAAASVIVHSPPASGTRFNTTDGLGADHDRGPLLLFRRIFGAYQLSSKLRLHSHAADAIRRAAHFALMPPACAGGQQTVTDLGPDALQRGREGAAGSKHAYVTIRPPSAVGGRGESSGVL